MTQAAKSKLALGCIADDYTGASDLANTLTRQGLRTVQTIGVPSDDLALPEVDAVVVSLKSRSIEAGLAVTRSRAAEKWLRGRGADHVLFKICSTFDSTDAGNIGPVMDALRADSGDAIVLVTPAFPETGRTVYQGNLFVGSVPLNESPLKDHPLNPMHDSNLVRVLARQSKTGVGLVDLADITRGPDAVHREPVRVQRGRSVATFDRHGSHRNRLIEARKKTTTTVELRGASRPKLAKMIVSQNTTTTRNSSGTELPRPPKTSQRVSMMSRPTRSASDCSQRWASFRGESFNSCASIVCAATAPSG